MPSLHHFLLVEVAVDNLYVVLDTYIPLRPSRVVVEHGNVAGQTVLEEAFWGDMVYDVEVVVEVDEMVGQS